MRPLDYLRVLRRRWWILIVGALIGVLLAFATQPSDLSVARATAPLIQYRATHLLYSDPSGTSASATRAIGFDRLALLTIAGPVPVAAMKRLGLTEYPAIIKKDTSDTTTAGGGNSNQRNRARADDASLPQIHQGKGEILLYGKYGVKAVAAIPDPATGALGIIATGDKLSVPRIANVFAEELLKYLEKLSVDKFNAKLADLRNQIDGLNSLGATLDVRLAASAADPFLSASLQKRRTDNQASIDELNQTINDTRRVGPLHSELSTLRSASEHRLSLIVVPGNSALSSGNRLMVGGGIGFFLALAFLVTLELVGARIRDVAGAEGAARMPVIAEIPVVKMNRVDRFVVATASDPASLTAEAYRSLRTSLLAMWQRHPKNVVLNEHGNGIGRGDGNGRPLRTLLVTSPGPAEGKSISVVNLAASFAETGVTVIVIDADFRRPTQTRYFDRPRSPNLGDLDLSCTPEDLEAVLQDTEVPGVRLAASAPTKSDPGHSIAVAKSAVIAAGQLADVVIVDSPPILLANDAADLALAVDASILLSRAGWTRRRGVMDAADLLRRLEATVIGLVVVGSEHGTRAGYYGYYGYYGYGYGYAHPGEVSIMKRLLPWKAAHKTPAAAPRGSHGVGAERPARSSRTADGDDPWV